MALINVDLGTGTITQMDESELDKTEGALDNDVETTTWVEYRIKGQPDSAPVHRSVHVRLKQGVEAFPAVQGF